MRFGPVPVEEAVGAISAHTIRAGQVVLKKGSVISGKIAASLRQAGVETVAAARLDPGDVGEDEAALQVAEALAGENVVVERPSTGRSNLYARRAGVLVASKALGVWCTTPMVDVGRSLVARSGDARRDRRPEPGHPVEHRAADPGFGGRGRQSPGAKRTTD